MCLVCSSKACILTNGNAKTFKCCVNIYINVDNGDWAPNAARGNNDTNNNIQQPSCLFFFDFLSLALSHTQPLSLSLPLFYLCLFLSPSFDHTNWQLCSFYLKFILLCRASVCAFQCLLVYIYVCVLHNLKSANTTN